MSVIIQPPLPFWHETIIHLKEVTSTAEYARRAASEGAPSGTCFIAEKQTVGHGRKNRVWLSPEGGLYFSLILRPKIFQPGFSLVFSLWIIDFLESNTGVECDFVWPNDIYSKGKKLGGILIEGTNGESGFLNIGVGLNINIPIRDEGRNPEGVNPISLCQLTGTSYNISYLAEDLLMHLQFNCECFENSSFQSYRQLICDKCSIIGKQAELTENGETDVVYVSGIGDSGELIVCDLRTESMRKIWNCDKIRVI